MNEVLDLILRQLKKVKQTGTGWQACCPSHDDRNPSLSITEGDDGRILMRCHSSRGCTIEAICRALGLEPKDLMPPDGPGASTGARAPRKPPSSARRDDKSLRQFATPADAVAALVKTRGRPAGQWTYHDADGREVCIVNRWDRQGGGKDFLPVSLTAEGTWVMKALPEPRPLYHLPDLAEAKLVVVTEGEKAADAARSLGFVATTCCGGCKAFHLTDWSPLAGKEVLLLPDADTPGEDYASGVASILLQLEPPARVRIVNLPGLPEGGDVVEWIGSHGDAAEPAAMKAELERIASKVGFVSQDAVHAEPDDRKDDGSITVPPERPRIDLGKLYGVLGEAVRLIEPHTEADPAGIYLQLLAAFGNACGRHAYVRIGGSRHYPNLFVACVGPTSTGRKGTSWDWAEEVMRQANKEWVDSHVKAGLTSGEGLIYHVRDAVKSTDDEGSETVVDKGSDVKTILCLETEFGSVLTRMARQGNSLSALLRQAWDGRTLSTLSKGEPNRATEALVSVTAHCTEKELASLLSRTDMVNGLANRFLWASVLRTKMLPFEGENVHLEDVARRIRIAAEHATKVEEVGFAQSARELWAECYADLTQDRPGILGAITARGPAQIKRLALIFALADMEHADEARHLIIDRRHLVAALDVWDYCCRAAAHIFSSEDDGEGTIADEVFKVIEGRGAEITQTEIHQAFGRHLSAKELGLALGYLRDQGRIVETKRKTTGRSATCWMSAKKAKEAKEVTGQ
jgi:hypothetical protein